MFPYEQGLRQHGNVKKVPVNKIKYKKKLS